MFYVKGLLMGLPEGCKKYGLPEMEAIVMTKDPLVAASTFVRTLYNRWGYKAIALVTKPTCLTEPDVAVFTELFVQEMSPGVTGDIMGLKQVRQGVRVVGR